MAILLNCYTVSLTKKILNPHEYNLLHNFFFVEVTIHIVIFFVEVTIHIVKKKCVSSVFM